MRLQNLELNMMIDYLNKLKEGRSIKYIPLEEGKRYGSIPWNIEKDLFDKFQKYKNNY